MPKSADKTKGSLNKPAKTVKKIDKSIKEKITDKVQKAIEYPRSYRLDAELMMTLIATLERINQQAPRKISEARLVKALILLSKELPDEQLLKAVKEVW